MDISYNWLKQYINVDVDPTELAKILTSIGLEVGHVDEVQTIKGGLEGLVVGEVLRCENHENSDHLHVTTVNIGCDEPLQIVCGAPNVATGQKVIVATIGTKLYTEEDSFLIKRSKIRGVESFGMLCAEDEIGIGSNHDGIIVLPQDAAIGTLAKDYYNLKNDTMIEVDITPNRVDAASHIGVARDLAAYYSFRNPNIFLTKPLVDDFEIQNQKLKIPVRVENNWACPRYSGVTISNISVTESPEWLKNHLSTIGLRPINNIVDITNFVLHELGQPLHAFDADKIEGGEVHIKNMPEGTPFITLDGVERKLSADDLMICDTKKPMCIAGVFGGIDSGVTETTKNIFLESAYFNPVNIRKTARRFGLNTDASFRYERGCDPENTIYALKRAALLIQEIAGGEISSEIIDNYPEPLKPFEVKLSLKKVNRLIGQDISKEIVETILNALEIKIINNNDDEYILSVPRYRVDVQRDVDIIEDVLRLYGYNQIEINDNLKSFLNYSQKPDNHKLQQIISEQLTALGFNEIMNNSLTKESYYNNLTTYPIEHAVKIMNSISSDLRIMRQTMLFGGLESITRNRNYKHNNLKFYEFGNCYYYDQTKKNNDDSLSCYSEEMHLGIWITGNKQEQSWAVKASPTTVFELKAYVENIFKRLGFNLQKLKYESFSNEIYSTALKIGNKKSNDLAIFGIVHPTLLKKMDIEAEVFFADLTWTKLIHEIGVQTITFSEISKYPEVKRDLALLLDKNISFAEIEKLAYETERKLLKNVTLFDVYEGKTLQPGKKSYAVSFILQDNEKTLTDSQIDAIMKKLQNNFETKLNAALR